MTRTEYMAAYGGKTREEQTALHRAYFAQFVTPGILSIVESVIGGAAIRASTDPHMNDIPLARWDALHTHLPFAPGIFARLTGHNEYALSDTVCIAKEAARQIAES